MLARERIVNREAHIDQCLCGFRLLFPSRLCGLFCNLAALFRGQAFGPRLTAFGRAQLGEGHGMRVFYSLGFRFRSVPFLADDVLHHGLGEQDGIVRGFLRCLWLACSGVHDTIIAFLLHEAIQTTKTLSA